MLVCMAYLAGKYLFTTFKEVTDRTKNSLQVQFGEPVTLLWLFTGMWVTF